METPSRSRATVKEPMTENEPQSLQLSKEIIVHKDSYRVKRWPGFDSPAYSPEPQGPKLFEEVRAFLKERWYSEDEWTYDLCALWVLQAYIASALPCVFYLILAGDRGGGKSTLLSVLAELTGGIHASDISVAALVHMLGESNCRPLLMDEYGEKRDAERDSALAAIVRDGYAPGACYVRYEPKGRTLENIGTYSAKAISVRDAVDDALADRGFAIPCRSSATGLAGFNYVQAVHLVRVHDLPKRLLKWSGDVVRSRERIREWAGEEAWVGHVSGVVGDKLGANRATQLANVALMVCRCACIDLTDSLKEALGFRAVMEAANEDVELDHLREAMETIGIHHVSIDGGPPYWMVVQADLMRAVNSRRKQEGFHPLRGKAVARIRRSLGVLDKWMVTVRGKPRWNIPEDEWVRILGLKDQPKEPPGGR